LQEFLVDEEKTIEKFEEHEAKHEDFFADLSDFDSGDEITFSGDLIRLFILYLSQWFIIKAFFVWIQVIEILISLFFPPVEVVEQKVVTSTCLQCHDTFDGIQQFCSSCWQVRWINIFSN